MAMQQFATAVAIIAQYLQRLRRELIGGERLKLQECDSQIDAFYFNLIRCSFRQVAPTAGTALSAAFNQTSIQ
ncbi:hypothetical protein D3C72_1977660 [compost metagenome]